MILRTAHLLLMLCFLASSQAFSQSQDSIHLQVSYVENDEIAEFYEFERIHFLKFRFTGESLKGKFYALTSTEFTKGVASKTDTLVSTQWLGIPHGSDNLDIHVMAQKVTADSLKLQLKLPLFYTNRMFKVSKSDAYTLKDITMNGTAAFHKNETMTLMVYTLPYQDPERPGYSFYCELSLDGIPPEQWFEKFRVDHYLVFKISFVN